MIVSEGDQAEGDKDIDDGRHARYDKEMKKVTKQGMPMYVHHGRGNLKCGCHECRGEEGRSCDQLGKQRG